MAASLLRVLPLDARGRRAVDETLADWAHEDERSGSPGRRVCRSVCGCASLFRVLAGLTVHETVTMPMGWLLGRLTLFVLAPSVLAVLPVLVSGTLWTPAGLAATPLLLPAGLAVMLPLGFFFAVARPPRDRSIPVLGALLWSFALAVVISNWAVPSANQTFREITFHLNGFSGSLPRGNPELSLFALASRAQAEGWQSAAAAHLRVRTALVVLCPAMIFLMIALRRLSRRRRLVWFALVPAAFFLSPLTDIPIWWRYDYRNVDGIGFWLLALVSVAAALVLNWRRGDAFEFSVPPTGASLPPCPRR
jgi:hypothetical protein